MPDLKQDRVELTRKRSRLQNRGWMQAMGVHSVRGYERTWNTTRKIKEEER